MRALIVFLAASALLVSCEKDDKFDAVAPITAPVATNSGTAAGAPTEMPTGHPPVNPDSPIPKPPKVEYAGPADYGKTGPLRWSVPGNWQASKPGSRMRLAEYLVPGTPEAAVLSVFYFGAAGGGGVDANVKRWVGQFDGGKAKPTTGKETVNGLTIHTVDVSGTYNAGMAGGNVPPKEGFRMRGAIVESSAGLFFFKLVGPSAVVSGEDAGWTSFVQSFAGG